MRELNLSRIICEAWEETCRDTPGAFNNPTINFFGPQWSYRYLLDRQPVNCYGDLIPRIITVRRNLRCKAGPLRMNPDRLPE